MWFNPPDPLPNILITLPSLLSLQLEATSSITSHFNPYASGIPRCSISWEKITSMPFCASCCLFIYSINKHVFNTYTMPAMFWNLDVVREWRKRQPRSPVLTDLSFDPWLSWTMHWSGEDIQWAKEHKRKYQAINVKESALGKSRGRASHTRRVADSKILGGKFCLLWE